MSEVQESGIRRSSRARRCTYGTYNQKILEQAYEVDERPTRKRKLREVDNNEGFQDTADVSVDFECQLRCIFLYIIRALFHSYKL